MLTASQLRQVAARSGVRDIVNVEIDVILAHLLQLFHERGLLERRHLGYVTLKSSRLYLSSCQPTRAIII